jgi:two-component system, NtrC family, sensor kinase
MIDLDGIPAPAFAQALATNLRRLAKPAKVYAHFLAAVRRRLGADGTVVYPDLAAGGARRVVDGEVGPFDEALLRDFAAEKRPALPRNLLLSPLTVRGRRVGVVGAWRREGAFERGTGRALTRLARVLGDDLTRRQEERVSHVLDRISGKVIAELRPEDLAYQILDGLYQLVHYDHSAALLTYDEEAKALRVEAEKVVWTKTKSAFVGHQLAVAPHLLEALRPPPPLRPFPPEAGEAGGGAPDLEALFGELLAYHRGHGIPAATSALYAGLFFDGEFLGLLKLARFRRPPFDLFEREVVERFLPMARVALRNARVKASLEDQALAAELRAGLVTLARAVAHDVNGAVGSILLLAEQAREDGVAGRLDPAQLAGDLEVIIDKARLCKRIFTNMLRLGSERSGSGPVDVNRVVRETLPLLEAQVGTRRILLEARLSEPLPPVRSSRQHLERILWNLVTNAIEALAGRGGRIEVATRAEGEDVVLEVRDDGPGIAPELLAKVQEPFFTTKPGGTGLGLAICRSLAWQYGGGLQLESAPGSGTVARVHLPLAATGGEEAPAEERRGEPLSEEARPA